MKKLHYVIFIAMLLILMVACTPKMPVISDESLTGSAQIIEGFTEIEEAEVIVEEGKINFYMVPKDEEVTKERLRELGSDFLKILSGYTQGDDLEGPTEDSYGGIYDYYDAEIIVEGYRGAILERGIKDKGKNEINWQK